MVERRLLLLSFIGTLEELAIGTITEEDLKCAICCLYDEREFVRREPQDLIKFLRDNMHEETTVSAIEKLQKCIKDSWWMHRREFREDYATEEKWRTALNHILRREGLLPIDDQVSLTSMVAFKNWMEEANNTPDNQKILVITGPITRRPE